jgi:hypothetical protein
MAAADGGSNKPAKKKALLIRAGPADSRNRKLMESGRHRARGGGRAVSRIAKAADRTDS